MHAQHFTGRRICLFGQFEQLNKEKLAKALRRLAAKVFETPTEDDYMIIVGGSAYDHLTVDEMEAAQNDMARCFPLALVIQESQIDDYLADVNEIESIFDLMD